MDSQDDKVARPELEAYLLGVLDYEDALRLQRRLVYEVSGARGELASLVICEHHPIITVGRLGSRSHIDCDDDELAARRLPVRWVNRGGGCNLHLPGQVVAYPILPFPPSKLAIREYLGRLERWLLAVLDEFGVRGTTQPNHRGIWSPGGQIASIGVSISRWVTYHGVALNVSGTIDQFRILHPEGNGSLRATTMEAQRQRPAPMAKVRESLLRLFVETFDLDRYHLFSQHPMLSQPRRTHAYAGSV